MVVHRAQDVVNCMYDLTLRRIDSTNFRYIMEIYQQGIDTGVATFETNLPSFEIWSKGHFDFGRIAAVDSAGKIVGWAALSPVSDRCVYTGVAELSIYVSAKSRRKGIGKFLLENLIVISERNGIWTLQAGIFSENYGSIALHEKCGFRKIGCREKIGNLRGEWKDNILMERRSKKVGI